jgi:hypothetical protein
MRQCRRWRCGAEAATGAVCEAQAKPGKIAVYAGVV